MLLIQLYLRALGGIFLGLALTTSLLSAGAAVLAGSAESSAGPSAAQEPVLHRYEFSEVHMGTRFRLVLYAADETTARLAARAAFARVAQLDRILSDYRADSELMRLCQKAGGPPVPVSEDLFLVLYRAQQISQLTQGALDVTVGPLVRLWRRARRTRRLPDPQEEEQARKRVGYRYLRLDPEHRTVQLLLMGMLLDVGALAKGYAVEEMLAVLRRYGITRALAAASGDIAVGDPPPASAGWKIGLAPLRDPEAEPQYYLLLQHAAVSTAGDAYQHVEINGVRYSHILDPRTGKPLTGRRSVSVVAPDGTTADGLDTALCVLGPQASLALIERLDAAACLFVQEGPRGVETYVSRRFGRYLHPDSPPPPGIVRPQKQKADLWRSHPPLPGHVPGLCQIDSKSARTGSRAECSCLFYSP
jgi:thiamine biosynthesis lipoprotein